jgi:hypothetical protein
VGALGAVEVTIGVGLLACRGCTVAKPQGTYTVVFDDGQRRTIRIQTVTRAPMAGKKDFRGWTFAKYLFGPDNETSYKMFAYVLPEGKGFKIKSGFHDDGLIVRALKMICVGTEEVRQQMGVTYALESGNCYVCGRTLTVPESITDGIGPECKKRRGG